MLGFLSFIASPIGKIVGYVGVVLLLISIAFGIIKLHDANVTRAATDKFNSDQLQQVIQDQKKMLQDTKKIDDIKSSITDQLATKNNTVTVETQKIEQSIDTTVAKETPEQKIQGSSDVLKNTFRQLKSGD